MEDASIVNAIERIEAALTRAEAASREAADLRQRLKSSVSRSLENLDTLIAGLRR